MKKMDARALAAIGMESCDHARQHWFQGLISAYVSDPLDHDHLEGVVEMRNSMLTDDDPPTPYALSMLLDQYYGWPSFSGVVLDEVGHPFARHSWNLLPGGAIMDAWPVAEDDMEAIRVVPVGTELWRRYRREWTPQYNPSMTSQHPELAGCRWSGVPDNKVLALQEKPLARIPEMEPERAMGM